jgi:hypothetical protein
MSEFEEAFTYVFAWHSLSDACPKCQNLNGREWHDQDIFQEMLWDPIWGELWDLWADQSMMHGMSGTCRCQLEVRVEVEIEEVHEYADTISLLESFF